LSFGQVEVTVVMSASRAHGELGTWTAAACCRLQEASLLAVEREKALATFSDDHR